MYDSDLDYWFALQHLSCVLTVAPYLRRETTVELQATKTYNRLGDDAHAPDAASVVDPPSLWRSTGAG